MTMTLSIGEYLRREGYSSRFKDDYLIVCHRLNPLSLWSFLRMTVFSQ